MLHPYSFFFSFWNPGFTNIALVYSTFSDILHCSSDSFLAPPSCFNAELSVDDIDRSYKGN